MQAVSFVVNCGQTAAGSDMIKIPRGRPWVILFICSDIFPVRRTV